MMDGQRREEDICLGLFAKYWEPAKVKTRLAASLGDKVAAQVYLTFLETLVWNLGRSMQGDVEKVIVFSPTDRESEFRELLRQNDNVEAPTWSFQAQGDGNLGQRLSGFFSSKFEAGNSKVMAIGTDSPTLPSMYLHQARWLLDSHDVVLGPSDDGGYYLVAARGSVPPIFVEIQWSTELVWSQTIGKLQEHRVKFAVLPIWYDVDNLNDLNRLRSEISTAIRDTTEANDATERYEVARRLGAKLRKILLVEPTSLEED